LETTPAWLLLAALPLVLLALAGAAYAFFDRLSGRRAAGDGPGEEGAGS